MNRADKADELRNAGFSGTDDEVIEQYLVWVDETRDACAAGLKAKESNQHKTPASLRGLGSQPMLSPRDIK
jgi:hypothetical protein